MQLQKKTQPGPLKDYYLQRVANYKVPVREAGFVVLDFEATGLDINKDHIISIGLIEIQNMGIHLNTAWHQIVKTSQDMPQNTAVIHQITDDMVAEGENLEVAMSTLLQRLKGKVMIAHHANIELAFLNKITQVLYGQKFIIPVIDTQLLAQRQLQRQQGHFRIGALRLFNLRNSHGLPAYKAHNALSDALATAELFLALANDLYPKMDCTVKDLLTS